MLWRRLTMTGLVLLVSGIALATCWMAVHVPTRTLLARAQSALSAGQFERAEQLARQVLARDSRHDEALFIAGMSCSRQDRFAEAVECFDRVSDRYPGAAEAKFRAADILILKLFQPTAAEKQLRHVLRLAPSHGGAQQHLSALLGMSGDTQGAMQLRLTRIRQGSFSDMDLLVLALGETIDDPAMRQQIVNASPSDPLTWLMQGNEAMQNRDLASAEELLRRVLKERRDLLIADAKLGRVLLDRGDSEGLKHWMEQLPAAADESAEIWLIRGNWASEQGDDRGAVHCYAAAVRRDPASQRANYQLAQSLTALGFAADAAPYAARAHALHDLTIAAKEYLSAGTPAAVARLVEVSQRGGLMWEAWGWQQIGRNMPAQSLSQSPTERPGPDSPRMSVATDDLERLVRQFPAPQGSPSTGLDHRSNSGDAGIGKGEIAFADDAAAAGLSFQYVPGDGPGEVGLRMFQFSGGGVAVLDFDQDGWPDLYFPQGHLWPETDADCASHLETRDRLFRNLGDGRFLDVTTAGALTGRGYGQGATIGDFDSDGFPDVYVATLKQNRLYRNNGDGTFADVTTESGTAGERWTTSCLMADLNGDGLADIYSVNYLEASDLFERICRNSDGRRRRCTPFELDASQDQLFLNLGDGRFEDVTRESGIVASGGKGLGIVAADFDGSGRLSLFVANDMMPNFYFMNETPSPGGRPRFTESALTAGLAYDRDGRAQGCMGIAVGDIREDGLLDLFVTNYYLESNTLYEQRPGQSFEDVTRTAGLRDPSLKMLGFGTQFLDADLDGWSDLVVLNGHVDDETYRGIPFHMPAQFFRNVGGGKFAEVSADTLGPWFAGRYLGRGLARLDWNRDGLEDFAATNLDSPVALLTNRSHRTGNSLRLTMHGVRSNRDAIGTTVRVQSRGREWVKQLTAGDGYESSNQRELVFGLMDAASADLVTIRWPSGATQQFRDVPTGKDHVVIEGRSALTVIP